MTVHVKRISQAFSHYSRQCFGRKKMTVQVSQKHFINHREEASMIPVVMKSVLTVKVLKH